MNKNRAVAIAIAGLLVGGFAGFLARPAAPLIGQLPLEVVITRGASLRGVDQILVPLAQSSFNTIAASGVIGAVVGFIIGVYAPRSPDAR